ncbi:hypothetical protein PV08_06559 [Exophiala spinifera]|uniref:Major facilitator superfamily (MFS) profile domain-containing protein n=1 Tax=Exophiala spinifera TaxID=91928 RepID=A0A0D2BYZ2_9EURO|nr:uncharacterized protein PV08_06559 [Exophiala spinifera]KIW16504.1 hypothetical protein PV08_06559 [Exophiala spinifera]
MAPNISNLKVHEKGASDPIVQRLAQEDRVPWYRKPNLRSLYFLLLPTCMGIEITSGFDSQMINALQISDHWQDYFHEPKGSWSGFINASYSLGAILSLPLVPIINDRFGRRWAIFIGSWVMVAGAIVQCFAQNAGNYIFARIMLGFGIPTCIVAASALIGELGYPKERPVLTSLFNVSYFVGELTAAGICFATNTIASNWSWRTPSILQAVPSLIQISLVLLLPESPRWLISKDRHEEAHEILTKYHAEGDRNSEFVRAEMAQIRATLHMEIEASKKSWLDLFTTAGMRRRVVLSTALGLFTQWSGNTLISYYLGKLLKMIGWTKSTDIQKVNVGLSAWSLITAGTAALLVTRFRRRVMYMTCAISLLCVYIAWTICMEETMTSDAAGHINHGAGIGVIFFIFAYKPAYNIGYNALTYTYLVELWPFAERSRGIAYFQLWGRLAAFFTTFINPIGLENIKWRWLIFYCCWLGFENVFIYFLFPETYGRTLEELAFIFEDKEKSDRAVAAVEKARAGLDDDENEKRVETIVEHVGDRT